MMIILDGVTTKELGLRVLRDYEDPSLPQTIDNTVIIPDRHGEYDFGANMGRKEFYLPIFLESQETRYERDIKIDQLKQILLDSRGKPRYFDLVFEERKDRKYRVRYSGALPVDTLLTHARFTLPLIAFEDPFANFIISSEEIIWDSDTPFMSDVPLDAHYIYDITSPETLTIHNFGTMIAKPIIEIEGSASTITLSANGKSFSFDSFSESKIIVDDYKYTVTKNGENHLFDMTGDFLNLETGANEVTVSGSSLNVKITFKFYAKYL
ncbi:hypothetical protein BTR23_07480 [Alkalihalophilus pseudofirmus]|nr:hypothetical protein BTR23_07480 [Alkalihalophilus pseudofirmus]